MGGSILLVISGAEHGFFFLSPFATSERKKSRLSGPASAEPTSARD